MGTGTFNKTPFNLLPTPFLFMTNESRSAWRRDSPLFRYVHLVGMNPLADTIALKPRNFFDPIAIGLDRT